MIDKHNRFIGFSIDNIGDVIGDSEYAGYIKGYLKDIKAVYCIEERNYIDKEYLIDYSKFYARSFDDISKYTTRLHFFKIEISKAEFYKTVDNFEKKIIVDGKESTVGKEQLKKINKAYLGFLVVKPIKDSKGNPIFGRTLLAPYPRSDGNEIREHLKQEYHVSLYGLKISIESLPFQMQDQSVGACATTACWISLHSLNHLFETPIHSLAEITEKSTTYPSLDRNFPSSGLSVYQMKNYFNTIGLETECLEMEPHILKEQFGSDHTVVPTLVKAYVDFGLPIIACLKLIKRNGRSRPDEEIYDQHAVVISGYRHHNGYVKELYVHDDRIGTYSKVLPRNSNNMFLEWNCKWCTKEYSQGKTYKNVRLEWIIIPIYPKLRLRFIDMYVIFMDHLKKVKQGEAEERRRDPTKRFSHELILQDLNNYKSFLLSKKFRGKRKILLRRFPRFIWVMRDTINDIAVNDQIFDATCNYQTGEPFENIRFTLQPITYQTRAPTNRDATPTDSAVDQP